MTRLLGASSRSPSTAPPEVVARIAAQKFQETSIGNPGLLFGSDDPDWWKPAVRGDGRLNVVGQQDVEILSGKAGIFDPDKVGISDRPRS